MALDLVTFRSPILSLFQSAIESLARSQRPPGAPRPGADDNFVRAATEIAQAHDKAQAVPDQPPAGIASNVWRAARLAYQFLDARFHGNHTAATDIAAQLQDGEFDPGWIETLTSYLDYFGPDGKLRQPDYIWPTPDMRVLSFAPGSVVALFGDWGTGAEAAVEIAKQMTLFNPDLLIHLGDIYYSGTPDECRRNFADILNRTFNRSRVPIYTLAGNHDMYCGGVGYYGLLPTLNLPPLARQPASFFCLRSTDAAWQFIAMDTGRFDHSPLDVQDVVVQIEPREQAWLAERIAEFPGQTILLSHHQFCSAFSPIGKAAPDGKRTPYNPRLRESFAVFSAAASRGRGRIAAWFWGHEHTLSIYAPYLGLDKGRCLGHGAVPVLLGDGDHEIAGLVDPPALLTGPLGRVDSVYAHGFAILRFARDGGCQVAYYNDNEPGRAFYRETLG